MMEHNDDFYSGAHENKDSGTPPQNNNAGWSQQQQQQQTQWQPQPPYSQGYTPNQQYKWDFKDYDTMSAPKKTSKGKNRGAKVFMSIIGVVLSLSVLSFAGIGIYSVATAGDSGISDKVPYSDTQNGASSQTADTANGNSKPTLNIADTPATTDDVLSVGGVLSTKQIISKVSPSVVGIVNCQNNGGWVPASEGSGIIMSADGYVITNAHVISGAQGIKVVLNSGDEYEATLIGADSKTDLAIVKIDATGLVAAEFGDSDKLLAGDKVVAIGNPGGLEFAGSSSQGIVSAVNRPLKSNIGYTMNCIQTDAAINPGNSGGALINEYGQVIGINSAKIAATDYEGIGFAIPINLAKPILDDLISHGMVTGRAKIGITLAGDVDELSSKIYSIPTGVIIAGVEKGTSIAEKGVLANDIITKIDDVKIGGSSDIYDILLKHKPGDTIKLTIFRRPSNAPDQTFDVSIVLSEDTGVTAQTELPSIIK